MEILEGLSLALQQWQLGATETLRGTFIRNASIEIALNWTEERALEDRWLSFVKAPTMGAGSALAHPAADLLDDGGNLKRAGDRP